MPRLISKGDWKNTKLEFLPKFRAIDLCTGTILRFFTQLCAQFSLSLLLYSFSRTYIHIHSANFLSRKAGKNFEQEAELTEGSRGRNSAGEFPRRCNDADYSPLLVHLSCKLLSARGPTVKFPRRATWPRPDQPLRVKFSASLFRWIERWSERVEWGPYSVLRTAYIIVEFILRLCSAIPFSRTNFGGSKWHYVTEIPPPIIRSLRRISYSGDKALS